MIKTIFFDLDETLLNMDQTAFERDYFLGLTKMVMKFDYPFEAALAALKDSVAAMYYNNGDKTNEGVFWEVFESRLKLKRTKIDAEVELFYKNEFPFLRKHTTANPIVPLIIQLLQKKGYQLVLATNPLFPRTATYQRINWANLKVIDFALITTYENSRFSKPNPLYFKEIIDKLKLKPEECLMIGNSIEEDLAALKLDMACILINEQRSANIDQKVKQLSLNDLYQEILNWQEVQQ